MDTTQPFGDNLRHHAPAQTWLLDRPIEDEHLGFLPRYIWNFPLKGTIGQALIAYPEPIPPAAVTKERDDSRGGSAIGVEILGFVNSVDGVGADLALWRIRKCV
jgi:hypothetical protein